MSRIQPTIGRSHNPWVAVRAPPASLPTGSWRFNPIVYDPMYEISPIRRTSATRNHEDRAHCHSYDVPESRSQAEIAGSIPVVRSTQLQSRSAAEAELRPRAATHRV